MSDNSISALSILRNPQLTLKWYVVPLLLVVLYVYNKQIHEKNWNVVLGGLALWGMDLFNEIWNSIVFHATNFAPVWGTPAGVGDTALLILIGYNVEISFMFAIMGVTVCLSLPADPKAKILRVSNRVFFAVFYTTLAVIVECFLNYAGVLTWEYPWWSRACPYLVWLIGYLPFFVMAFLVHDMKRMKNKLLTLGVIYGVDALALIGFGSIGWM